MNSSRRSKQPPFRIFRGSKVVHKVSVLKLVNDMKRMGLSKKHTKDAETWKTVASTFHEHFDGDPRNFLSLCSLNALYVLQELNNVRYRFPYLRGPKIGPLWLRMLRENWDRWTIFGRRSRSCWTGEFKRWLLDWDQATLPVRAWNPLSPVPLQTGANR